MYVGEFRAGQKHGDGKYSYADGSEYDGQWAGGLQHGWSLTVY